MQIGLREPRWIKIFTIKRNIQGLEKTCRKPTGFWESEENVKNFLENLKIKLHLKTAEDWNKITSNHVKIEGGSSLLHSFSMYELKVLGCPEGKSIFEKERRKPGDFWKNKENIIKFIENIKLKLNLKTEEDWNNLKQQKIKEFGGKRLLKYYSMNEIKSIGFPNGNFKKSLKPIGYWNNEENIKKFLLKLEKNENLQTAEDWNLITKQKIVQYDGSGILKKFSLYEIKCMGFPAGKYVFNKQIKSSGYWENKENIDNFLHFLREKLDLKTPYDWNLLTQKQIIQFGGNSLLKIYSLFEIKCLGCSDVKFLFLQPNKYKPHGFWNDNENIKQFLNDLKEKFNLNSIEDWNRISKSQIILHGGGGLLKKEILKENNQNSSIGKRSTQRWLFLQIQKLFPQEEIVEDYFHSEISRKSGFHVQFDIFILNKNIAIEYHGEQHYDDIPSLYGPIESYIYRDNEKAKLCKQFGIQLIVIPYWWDNRFDSLKETIVQTLKGGI